MQLKFTLTTDKLYS